MKIYIIRHGLPNYELDCLTPNGSDQAFRLGEKFKSIPIDAFYVSTQGRARETAEHLIKHHSNAVINYVDWAREDFGGRYFGIKENGRFDWFFMFPKWATLFKSQELSVYGNDWIKHPEIAKTTMPQGFKIMAESVDSFMLELGYEHDRVKHTYKKVKNDVPENVVVVAHGGFAYSFISNLLDIPYPEFVTTHCVMDCTAVTLLEIWDGIPAPIIIKYNDTSHLDNNEKFDKLGV